MRLLWDYFLSDSLICIFSTANSSHTVLWMARFPRTCLDSLACITPTANGVKYKYTTCLLKKKNCTVRSTYAITVASSVLKDMRQLQQDVLFIPAKASNNTPPFPLRPLWQGFWFMPLKTMPRNENKTRGKQECKLFRTSKKCMALEKWQTRGLQGNSD